LAKEVGYPENSIKYVKNPAYTEKIKKNNLIKKLPNYVKMP
jgi:hypothetical protein